MARATPLGRREPWGVTGGLGRPGAAHDRAYLPFTSIKDTFCFGFFPRPRKEKNDFFCVSGAVTGAATGFLAGAGGAALGGRGAACAEAGFAGRAVFLAAAVFAGRAAFAFDGFFGLAALRGGAAFRPTVFFAFRTFMIPPCVSSITEMSAKSKDYTAGNSSVAK